MMMNHSPSYLKESVRNRQFAHNEVERGAKEIIFHGESITILDDRSGWTYSWRDSTWKNLDEILEAIEHWLDTDEVGV
jgi:hypothetical protein